MNELFLILVFFIVIMLVQNFYAKSNPRSAFYIRLISGIIFLPFIWFSADADKLSIKLLLTAVVLSAIYKAIKSYGKLKIELKN
jgi:Na+-driven multidrug efflux pump